MKKMFFVFVFVFVFGSLVFALPATQYKKITWDAPTLNTDGTPLDDLAGYKIYWRTLNGEYSEIDSKDVGNVNEFVLSDIDNFNFTPVKYFFVVTTYNILGYESPYSNEIEKLFFRIPNAPTNLTSSK